MKKIKAVFILGPTAVGKTDISVRLAKKLNGEIISSDSVQIFKGLDIGSAKVTKEEMQGVPHYAIDILEPEEEFSVFDFVQFTKEKIADISSRGKLPIVVGGTGLYVKALILGYDFGGKEKDITLREDLEKLGKEKGNNFLFELLKEKNPAMAEKTDCHNTVRLVRALEIAILGGEKGVNESDIDSLVIALNREREELYRDINSRVDIMLDKGLLVEVESLRKKGLTAKNQSMKAIGYKEVLAYLDGEYDYARMVELLKQHSRNYAKRQLTFLRGMQNINFVDTSDREKAFEEVLKLVKQWENKEHI